MKPFRVAVKSVDEAKLLLNTLADYDIFQFENKIKPDYCNAGGLEVFDESDDTDSPDGSWSDWSNDDGDTIDDLLKADQE
jgi:hypothetical protein